MNFEIFYFLVGMKNCKKSDDNCKKRQKIELRPIVRLYGRGGKPGERAVALNGDGLKGATGASGSLAHWSTYWLNGSITRPNFIYAYFLPFSICASGVQKRGSFLWMIYWFDVAFWYKGNELFLSEYVPMGWLNDWIEAIKWDKLLMKIRWKIKAVENWKRLKYCTKSYIFDGTNVGRVFWVNFHILVCALQQLKVCYWPAHRKAL